jgi:cytochrome c biogenesis protein CcmG, thiol:disulfide interchange protein DsbE
MKYLLILLSAFLLGSSITAQHTDKLPSAWVQGLDGRRVDAATFSNNGKPIIVNFWATWCAPCKKELSAISEVYDDWQARTGVKLIAVSIDDARSMARVKPYVDGQDWDYEVYLDPNGDLKRALNVSSVPHTFLLNGKGEIVWQHNNYVPGDENELFRKVLELSSNAK